MILESINPASGKREKTFPTFTDAEIETALTHAKAEWQNWQGTGMEHRANLLKTLSIQLTSKKNLLARLMAMEMGKPVSQGEQEIAKCALAAAFFAEEIPKWLHPENIKSEMKKSVIVHEALGVIFGIFPWNFPFWQVMRSALPALMAGNTFVFKHAPRTTGCGEAIADLFHVSGFPQGALTHLKITEERAAHVIRDPRVAMVTFTGSGRAGAQIASIAGSALKKSVLELGGSDPYVVLADADLQQAAEICVQSRMANAGQVCIAAKRFIVDKNVLNPFTELVRQEMAKYVAADPLAEDTHLGPLAREDLREAVQGQVLRSIKNGAKLVLGGKVPDGPGYFYPATLLTQVQPGMAAFDEEVFGPVAAVVSAKNEQEAFELANRTRYGLGAAVFTADTEKGFFLAQNKLRAGSVFINSAVRSDPRLPFGGFGESGYGRELGRAGVLEFTGAKSIVEP